MRIPFFSRRPAAPAPVPAPAVDVRLPMPELTWPADVLGFQVGDWLGAADFLMGRDSIREYAYGRRGSNPLSSAMDIAVFSDAPQRLEGWLRGDSVDTPEPGFSRSRYRMPQSGSRQSAYPTRSGSSPQAVFGVAAECYLRAMSGLHDADPDVYSDQAWNADVRAHEFVSEVFTGLVVAFAQARELQDGVSAVENARKGLEDVQAAKDPVLDRQMVEVSSARAAAAAGVRSTAAESLEVFVTVALARAAQLRAVRETELTAMARARAAASVSGPEPAPDARLVRLSAVSSLIADRSLGALEEAEAEIIRQRQLRELL